MITILDINPTQRCVWPRPSRPARTPRSIGPIEQGWINYQPYFASPVAQHELPTVGTMAPFQEELIAVDQQYKRLVSTQCCRYHAENGKNPEHHGQPVELETVAQELARNGISSISISSSPRQQPDDDEFLGPSLADAIGPTDGVPYEYPDPALVRRIEWERYALSCGPITRVFWAEKDGELTFVSDQPNAVLPKEKIVQHFGASLLKVLDGRTLEELRNDWERVRYYGSKVGSLLYGVKTGEHEPIQSIIDAMMAEDDEDESTDGPRELGLHDDDHPNEPGEAYLFPVTLEEVATTLARGLTLSETELAWLESHPNEARELFSLASVS